MNARTRNALLVGCAILIATTVARAQSIDPIGDLLNDVAPDSVPNASPSRSQTVARPLSASDQSRFSQGLAAARRGDVSRARDAISTISDRVARKTVTWALVDTSASSLSFAELDAARHDLDGFPRPARRQIAAERAIGNSGKSPGQIVEWFAGQPPQSDKVRPIRICRNAWIGHGCHIMKGVTVGEAAIIAAGSVVVKDVPPYSIFAGNPGRVVADLRKSPETPELRPQGPQ